MDASHITDASRYISLLLLSLRAMLTLELPHVNVLSKVDLLGDAATAVLRRRGSQSDEEDGMEGSATDQDDDRSDDAAPKGGLAFNLDYYTEVQDLSYLVDHLNASMGPRRAKRFSEMNEKICEMIEEFGLVQFETLAVEDKRSMMRLQRVLDKATGYIYVGNPEKPNEKAGSQTSQTTAAGLREVQLPGTRDPELSAYEPHGHQSKPGRDYSRRGTAASANALFSVADQGAPSGWGSAADVQERWVDHRDAWEPFEARERLELEQHWREKQKEEEERAEAMEKEQQRMRPIKERR